VRAVYEEITTRLKKAGVRPLHVEGTTDAGWMLLDYGSVIVHIFSPEEREYYRLEKLWDQANIVLRIQ
jgi:ribosome-associated protein